MESFSKSLPRKGNKEAKSSPGYPRHPHACLPTLIIDFVARQVEGGHRFVVLESFSKSLPRKGNKEAESSPGSQNTHPGLPTLSTDSVVRQIQGGDGFVVLQAFCKGLAQKRNKAASANLVPVPNEPPPGPRAPGRHGGNQTKSKRPNKQMLAREPFSSTHAHQPASPALGGSDGSRWPATSSRKPDCNPGSMHARWMICMSGHARRFCQVWLNTTTHVLHKV